CVAVLGNTARQQVAAALYQQFGVGGTFISIIYFFFGEFQQADQLLEDKLFIFDIALFDMLAKAPDLVKRVFTGREIDAPYRFGKICPIGFEYIVQKAERALVTVAE